MPKRKDGAAVILMRIHLREINLEFTEECQFCERGWKFDFLIPSCKVAIEIDGGVGRFKNPKGQWIRGGRHNREDGYTEDCRKLNRATMEGYRVLRFTSQQVLCGEALEFLKTYVVPIGTQ